MKKFWLLLIIFVTILYYAKGRIRDERMEKLDKLRMTPKTFEKMKNLHKNTYYTAVKAIIGKMGSILYKELPKNEKRLLARCLDKIEDRRELITSAKCVVTARKRLLKMKSEMTQNYLKFTTPSPLNGKGHGWKAFLQKFDDFDRLNSFSSSSTSNLQTPSNLTFIPKKQQSGFFKEREETRRFAPRKLKKTNYDYSFIRNSNNRASFKNNIFQKLVKGKERQRFPSATKLKFIDNNNLVATLNNNTTRKPSYANHGSLLSRRRISITRLSHLKRIFPENDKLQLTTPEQSTVVQRPTTKGYKILNFLRKKLTVLPYSNKQMMKKAHIKQKPMSRRFAKFIHRTKRNVWFEDSKDHNFKEKKFKIITKNQFNGLSSSSRKSDNPIISSVTNVIREFTSDNSENEDKDKGNEHLKWTKTYNRLMKVRNAIDEQKRVPGAKVYEHRMYDLVLERDEPSLSPSERRSPQGILHESMKLLGDLTAKSNGSAPYTRLFSPRFMPLMPLNEGKRQPETYLSPTIMAMYDESNDTNTKGEVTIGNVPKVMNSLGVTSKDQGKIMQLLMDFTKTNTYIDESLKIYEVLGMFDEDIGGPILNATEKILGSFKNLEKGLFWNQKEALENQGFAFLKKEQMAKVLKDQGWFCKDFERYMRNWISEIPEDEIDLADFDIYDKMTDEEMEISLWKTIENIAMNKTDVLRPSETHIRQKRDKICYVCPTVLSPLLFTVQTGILIIGPLVISPTAFAPPILNPSIMSPWLISPGIFDPLILSPYIMTPFILGPLAFTPFILTPYFLSPNVLNPYVVTSLILSPIGLSPDVLSPQFIGATILSPSVLSPPVLNPTLYTTSAFSPSFLS